MTQNAETVQLLDARIKGKKKFSGQWHPEKPSIMFYPDTAYRLHPACFDPDRFDLVKPGEPPAPQAPAPAIMSKELPIHGTAPTAGSPSVSVELSAPTPEAKAPVAPTTKELPPRGKKGSKGADA